MVKDWAKRNHEMPYEETSALDGTNVERTFEKIADDLLAVSLLGLENNVDP